MKISAIMSGSSLRTKNKQERTGRTCQGIVVAYLTAMVFVVLEGCCCTTSTAWEPKLVDLNIMADTLSWSSADWGDFPDSLIINDTIRNSLWPTPLESEYGPPSPELHWFPLEKPPEVEHYTGQVLHEVCPICKDCYPYGSDISEMTLLYCDYPCCNLTTYFFTCRTTRECFRLQVNECDQIKWGMMK